MLSFVIKSWAEFWARGQLSFASAENRIFKKSSGHQAKRHRQAQRGFCHERQLFQRSGRETKADFRKFKESNIKFILDRELNTSLGQQQWAQSKVKA